jgi:radical SAM superfamily enzyme with C-terminal helix-hairpin-helix motif
MDMSSRFRIFYLLTKECYDLHREYSRMVQIKPGMTVPGRYDGLEPGKPMEVSA